MLHDLIYALCGNPGNIFKEMSVGKIEVIPGLPHISPSEESALNRLLHLATRFLFFQRFTSAHTSTIYTPGSGSSGSLSDLKPGCYIKAFCVGLQSVLSEYRQKLLNIEKEILKDEHLSLMYVHHETDAYHVLFDALYEVILTIKSRRSHGCQILDVLYRASRSGNSHVRSSLLKILQHCHVVMYKQLSAWLLHGILIDRHNEFFIMDNTEQQVNTKTSTDKSVDGSNITTENDEGKSKDKFVVRHNYLPFYIPHRVASVICFVGSSLHLFESDHKELADTKPTSQLVEMKAEDIFLKLEGVLQEKEQEFLGDLHLLQKAEEFVIEDFEQCVDKIRSVVAKELWLLCVERAQLISHLYMLKDFYLLGRGELFLVFIEEAGPLLKNPPSRVTEHDVQHAFMRAAAKVQMEDELPFQLFQLTIRPNATSDTPSPFVNINTIDDGWARLGMSFKVKWPLHTIFKPILLEKYNQLFKFLLRVRRTQSALQKIWLVQMRNQQESDVQCDVNSPRPLFATDRLQWQCRNHMQIFIDNLQYYLQADVLESHFSHMLEKIRNTSDSQRDFESIITAHDNFLNSLLAQCFILSNTVCISLIEILDICQQFCDVVLTSSLLITKTEVNEKVAKLWDLYSKKAGVFFQVLSGVCTHQCNSHIAQLTLRLDYNRYYSSLIRKSNESRFMSH